MNSGLRPIPPSMPVDRAADLMVRRGEAPNVHVARYRVHSSRARYGSTYVARDPAIQAVESPREMRLPYRDD